MSGFLPLSDEDWTGGAAAHLSGRGPHDPGPGGRRDRSVNSFRRTAVIDYSAAKAYLANCCKTLSKEVADLVLLLASDRAGNVTPYQSPGRYATVLSAGCPLR